MIRLRSAHDKQRRGIQLKNNSLLGEWEMSAGANWEADVYVFCGVCVYVFMYQRRGFVCILVLCVFSRRWMQSEGKESRQALRLPPSPSFRDSKHPLKRDTELRTSMQTLFNYRDQKCLHKTVTQRHLLSVWFYSLGNSSLFFFFLVMLWALLSPWLSSKKAQLLHFFKNRFYVLTS